MARKSRKAAKINKEIEEFIDKKLSLRAQDKMISAVRGAYEHIMNEWPKYTYWSAANNRISITGRDIKRLEPHKRPDPIRKGVLSGKFAEVRHSELAKLTKIRKQKRKDRKDRLIVIGNAVPYAADVGFDPGRGIAIYGEAAAIAASKLRGNEQ